jgi:ankyrin repeat protein
MHWRAGDQRRQSPNFDGLGPAINPDEELVRASEIGNLRRVRELLDSGADANATIGDKDLETQRSALDAAAQNGHLGVVEALALAGARMDTGEHGGTTALTFALLAGRLATADLLYRHGARADLLIGFCFTNNYAAIHEILHREPQRWREYANDSVRSGNVEMLRENLERNKAISAKEDGFELLRGAIFQWRLVHRWGLHGQGVDDAFDRTRFQHLGRMLLDWGVDPKTIGPSGETFLHLAAGYGRDWSPTEEERIAHSRQLIERGADLNARNKDGLTPLGIAIRQKRTKLADFLRGQGGME